MPPHRAAFFILALHNRKAPAFIPPRLCHSYLIHCKQVCPASGKILPDDAPGGVQGVVLLHVPEAGRAGCFQRRRV